MAEQQVQKHPVLVNVNTDEAPKAIGPYVQGKIVPAGSDLFYSSGVIPIVPSTGQIISEQIEDQTKQVMESLQALLKAAGTDYSNVIKATVFLDDMNNFAAVNKIYETYFTGENKPARSCVAVKTLPRNVKIEIEVIAYVPKL